MSNKNNFVRSPSVKTKILIKKLRQENNELQYILKNKIFSSKAYRLWQSYNKIKRIMKYNTYIVVLILFAPFYFLIITFFFVLYKALTLFTRLVQKTLQIDHKSKKLDGVSFIIPTWNNALLVTDCIRHLDKIITAESSHIPKEIIVIDNGSEDGTYDALLKIHPNQPLHIIRLETNEGFSRAIKRGANQAKYNYIYLLNNDMIPEKNFFKRLVDFAENKIQENKPFFGISSQIFFYDKKKRREESGKTYIKPFLGYLYVAHCVLKENLEESSITAYVGGGSSLINKYLFLKLGGYDYASYRPLYVEDLDLSFIAWEKGFPSYFLPDSKVIHYHQSSSKKLKKDPSYFMYKNWLVFILKNTSSTTLFLRHILLYPILAFSKFHYIQYAFEAVKNSFAILRAKLKMSIYKDIYKDKELIDFITFESKFK